MSTTKKKALGKNFWLYRTAMVLIYIGNVATTVAINWWLLETYQKAVYMSYVSLPVVFITIFSNILLAPLGDRFNRKYLILFGLIAQMTIVLTIIIFIKLNLLSLFYLIGYVSLFALAGSLIHVGGIGFIAEIVESDLLPKAYNIIMRINYTISLISAAFAGWLFYKMGMVFSFYLLMILMMGAFTLIYFVRFSQNKNEQSVLLKENYLAELSLGFKYTLNNRIIKGFFLYSLIIGIAFGPMQIIVIYAMKEIFNLNAFEYGLAMSCMAGGIITGSFVYEFVFNQFNQKHRLIFISSLGFSICFVLMATLYHVVLFLVAIFIMGICRNWINVSVDAKLIKALPNNMRTKVFSNISFFSNVTVPISSLLAGYIIDGANLQYILMFNALLIFSMSLVFLHDNAVVNFMNAEDEAAADLLKVEENL